MTDKRNSKQADLDRLTDALVEDVLVASDDEILAELREDSTDPASFIAGARAVYERAVAEVAKSRLAAAKIAVEADRRSTARSPISQIEPSAARARLQRIVDQYPETKAKLTMAARKGEGLSDADVKSMLEDLDELGIRPPSENQDESS